MKKTVVKYLAISGLCWSFLVLFVLSSFIQGFVLSYLWFWFMCPLGVKSISVLHAMGIMVLMDFVSYHYYDYKKSEEVGMVIPIQYIVLRPLAALFVGYIIHLLA